MSQMLKDQKIYDEAITGVKLLEEKLGDGSTVYNVTIFDSIIFHCTDLFHAQDLFRMIDESFPCKIH